ncbi:protein farnesyltransferase/geranylgeranyltransferase type-1 subunit alpha-like [Chironomus tepperi]|uniref:protein farnesyltransferase/geranylgeranyltransferase type-1 subunit alpha-like n=1 Tax=Chironomus tepperi TaxID=113505 RepID=UPI00391F92DA
MIKEDIRNNSAWNQRYFIINQRGKVDFPLVKNEFRYAFEKIKLANENDSSWNYIRGLLLNFGAKRLWQFQELVKYCEDEFYEKENTNRNIVAFLIDLKIEMILDDSNDANELLISQKIYNLCTLMGHKYDKIRKNYWQFVHKHFCFEKIIKRDTMNDSFNNEGGVKKDDSWKGRFAKKANATESPIINEIKVDKKKKTKKSFHNKK